MRWFLLAVWLLFLVLVNLVALSFGTSRDFGAFILLPLLGSTVYPMVVFAQFVVSVVLLQCWSAARVGLVGATWLLLVGAPALAYYGNTIRDAYEFVPWLWKYDSQIAMLTSRPGVLTLWDSWGFAGNEWDGYLVSDPGDRLFDAQHAAEWRKQVDLSCDFGVQRRLRPGLCFVVTYECPIDAAKVQNVN